MSTPTTTRGTNTELLGEPNLASPTRRALGELTPNTKINSPSPKSASPVKRPTIFMTTPTPEKHETEQIQAAEDDKVVEARLQSRKRTIDEVDNAADAIRRQHGPRAARLEAARPAFQHPQNVTRLLPMSRGNSGLDEASGMISLSQQTNMSFSSLIDYDAGGVASSQPQIDASEEQQEGKNMDTRHPASSDELEGEGRDSEAGGKPSDDGPGAQAEAATRHSSTLSARLRLAMFKVRTNQTSIPFEQLQQRQKSASPAPTTKNPDLTISITSANTNTHNPSVTTSMLTTSTTNTALTSFDRGDHPEGTNAPPPVDRLNLLPVPSLQPTSYSSRFIGVPPSSPPGADSVQPAESPSATAVTPLKHLELASPKREEELTSSVVKGRAADGLVQLWKAGQ